MSHRLAGAIAKFNRSKEQFDELRNEVAAYFAADPPPFFSVGSFDHDTWEWVHRLQVRTEIPLQWGVVLGDCVHNLRSALDHVVCQVTLLDGGEPNTQTQFPIVSESSERFQRQADKRIPSLTATHRAIVESAQPFHRGTAAASHPLAVLASLSNADKHRRLNMALTTIGYNASDLLDALGPPRGVLASEITEIQVASSGPLTHDSPFARIRWAREAQPPANVTFAGTLPLAISFGDPGVPFLEIPKIADAVLTVIQLFLAEFPETEYVDRPES